MRINKDVKHLNMSRAIEWTCNDVRRHVEHRAKEYKVKYDELLFNVLIAELVHFDFKYYEGKLPKRIK